MAVPLQAPTLAQVSGSRDNNLNLMRMIAATLVLFSHCYPIAQGTEDREPLMQWIGFSFGRVAVDLFFIASGFLVTASLFNRPSIKTYLRARLLRIYPGLMVTLLLTILLVGCCFTTLAFGVFLSDPLTWKYLLKNLTLLKTVEFNLPGAFENNVYPRAVNGSLWTLTWELRMYLSLILVWWLCKRFRWNTPKVTFGLAVYAVIVSYYVAYMADLNPRREYQGYRMLATFYLGSCYYHYRDRISLQPRYFLYALLAVGIPLFLQLKWIFYAAYLLTLPYLVFYLAYIPKGFIRRYNRLGDYSYGMYIYAFLVQQCVAACFPGIGVGALFGLAFAITLLCAIVSWYAVEKPALRWK